MHRDLSERDKATILMLLTMHLSFLYMPLISKDPRHASKNRLQRQHQSRETTRLCWRAFSLVNH